MSFAAALGPAIVESLVVGTVVALAFGLAGARARSAPVRHAFELLGLVAVALHFVVVAADGLAAPATSGGTAQTWTSILGHAYLGGAAIVALRLALGVHGVARLRRSAEEIPAAWSKRIATLSGRIGLRTRVLAGQSNRIDAPIVIGWWRPLILVPAGWLSSLPPETIEAVLLHELWHVRRRDVLFGYAQAGIEVLLCFHPAAWWLSSRARSSREHCCDDAAARACGRRRYAAALLAAEESRQAFTLAPGFGGGQLLERVARVLGRRPPGRSRWLPAALVALLAIGLSSPARAPESDLAIPWLPARVQTWEAEFVAAGERHGVDPELLAIVALVESEGNARAVSPVGAQGLMQVMPSTANDVARQRGLPEPTRSRLLEPRLNLDFGAYYLARQLDAFDDNDDPVEVAAAAYNGGPGRVRRWLDKGRATTLPRETERYRKLVSALYRERHDPDSPAFARLAARRGY